MSIVVPADLTTPSPFYRVTAKALIYDDQHRLLVVRNHNGNWELPGGGWEHDETFHEALGREVAEELGAGADTIGDVCFMYRGVNPKRGFMTLRLVAPVTLRHHDFTVGDDIMEAKFINRDEFLSTDFTINEGDVREHLDKIFPYL